MMNSLVLVYHWFCRATEGSVYKFGKEEELPSSNFQFGK